MYQINFRTGNVSLGQTSSLNLKLIGRSPGLWIVFWFASHKKRASRHTTSKIFADYNVDTTHTHLRALAAVSRHPLNFPIRITFTFIILTGGTFSDKMLYIFITDTEHYIHIYIFIPNTSGDATARATLCHILRRMGVRSACMSIFSLSARCAEWKIFKRKLIFLSPKMPFNARNIFSEFTRSHIHWTGNAPRTQCIDICFWRIPILFSRFWKTHANMPTVWIGECNLCARAVLLFYNCYGIIKKKKYNTSDEEGGSEWEIMQYLIMLWQCINCVQLNRNSGKDEEKYEIWLNVVIATQNGK